MKKDSIPANVSNTTPADSEDVKFAEQQAAAFQVRDKPKQVRESDPQPHLLGPGRICDTGPRGQATPQGDSLLEIVLDATEGFIPLWEKDTVLRWRFQERSFDHFKEPEAAKKEVERLLSAALVAWGPAAPVKFKKNDDVWDFEIVMRSNDDCKPSGCVLASAFFPDAGRHEFVLYPRMFTQSKKEQVDTFCHELGHVFGLRHFFANISETKWPSVIFGTHEKFSIMNYNELSELTDTDREDLTQLYTQAWSGQLTDINGTPIRFVRPYHTLLLAADSAFAINEGRTMRYIKTFEELTRSRK
jgi:hypothetical protein